MKQNLTIETNKMGSFVTYILIFMTAMNFCNRFNFVAMVSFCFYVICRGHVKIKLNATFIALITLAITWIGVSPEAFSSIFSLLRPVTFVLFYILGYMLCSESENSYSAFFKITLASGLGGFLHFILNYLINPGSQMRNSYDYWTNSILSATAQASLACVSIGVSIALIFSKTKLAHKVIAGMTVFMIIKFNLILAGRTIFVLIGITAIAVFLYNLKSKQKVRKIISFIILLAIIYLLYITDTFGVKTLFEHSSFYYRFFENGSADITSDTRIIKKMNYLSHFFDYPFGGVNFRKRYGYAHDIFLDTYDECGIIALIAMITILSISFINLIKVLMNYRIPEIIRNSALCVFLVCYLQFMVEPILQGMPWLFVLFCLMDGALTFIANLEDKQ